GDGNIRYYEISSEKPYVHYLTEYRSSQPQKGM
ncbi:coronin-2A isoform X2, partial [Silurus meridionalis]